MDQLCLQTRGHIWVKLDLDFDQKIFWNNFNKRIEA